MKREFIEEARKIVVEREYEVIVAGGGIAGVAAAVAAAREGRKTALVEKMFSLGGLATLGNVAIYLPICDGTGRKIIGGFGEELLLLSVRGREDRIPAPWRDPAASAEARSQKRFRVDFTPAEYQLALEELVLKEGVELFYDTRICSVRKSEGAIDSLIVENKSGRFGISATAYIDATGDADLAFFAGAPTESLSSNVRAGWGYYSSSADGCGMLVVSKHFTRDASPVEDDPFRYRGDSGRELSAQTIDSRTLLREFWAGIREKDPGAELVRISELPGFRMTRRIVGEDTIAFEHAHLWKPDTVGLFPSWREAGPVWALSYGSLYSKSVRNLACAGRCLSASGAAWDITRAIPVCSLSGEAAGVAAALACGASAADRGSFPDVDAGLLREKLAEKGNLFDPTLLATARKAPE